MKDRVSTRVASKEDLHFDWELRPGGLLVQKRFIGSSKDGPLITLKISHNSCYYHLTLPFQSTFGNLKTALARKTGLEPKEQRLLFRGKEKNDEEFLHMAGLEDMSKVVLMEDPASKERKLQEIQKNQIKSYEDILKVRAAVDDLSNKVLGLRGKMENGASVEDKEFVSLAELLMVKLLDLDGIKADGDARVQRRLEVRRVQGLIDAIDKMKSRKSSYSTDESKHDSLTNSKSVALESEAGTCTENTNKLSTKITQDWESFD